MSSKDFFNRRCAGCKSWRGDKTRARAMHVENPMSMDFLHGWAEDGDCMLEHKWLNTSIEGDATVVNTVDANFGCILWTE